MKSGQRKIHDDGATNSLSKSVAREPQTPQKISHGNIQLIKQFFANSKGFLTISALFALWATVGEIALAHPYKFSTFIGMRGGNVLSEEIKASTPAEATKQEVVMAAGGTVELKKDCQKLRNQLGQNAFAQCVHANGTYPVCNFKKSQAEMQPCDGFTAETLVDNYQAKTNQGASK